MTETDLPDPIQLSPPIKKKKKRKNIVVQKRIVPKKYRRFRGIVNVVIVIVQNIHLRFLIIANLIGNRIIKKI